MANVQGLSFFLREIEISWIAVSFFRLARRQALPPWLVRTLPVFPGMGIPGYLAGECFHVAPTRSVIPVVGDGTWVWTEPPKDQTGYLEPRPYELKVGIEIIGNGNATAIKATTPVPIPLPEQQVDRATIEKVNCAAEFRRLTPEAAQLILAAPAIGKGGTVGAVAHMRLTLHKEYQGYAKEQFPDKQPRLPKEFAKAYLYDSPGIQTRADEVQALAEKVGGQIDHPWDKAKAFHAWVWENIRPVEGPYTSVVDAIKSRVGDCEEHASVFTALCRASGIPARLVWVPNHNWAEFFLRGRKRQRALDTGPHVVLFVVRLDRGARVGAAKGGQHRAAGKTQAAAADGRLDAMVRRRPTARWFAELRPLPPEDGEDAGPGARSKNARGEWVRVGTHKLDAYLRDRAQSASRRGVLRKQ